MKSDSKNNFKIKKPTKGEDFIEDYLFKSLIRYKSQVKITDLEWDDKKYRVVDFYLPNLGFYLEYNGLYNETKEDRQRYKEKWMVYQKNNRPTISIKPEELGILDYVFDVEVKRLLGYKKFHSPFKAFRYALNRYLSKGKLHYLLFSLYFYVMGILLEGYNIGLAEVFSTILSWTSFLIAIICIKIFAFDIVRNLDMKIIIPPKR